MKEKDVVDITPGASYAKFAHEPRIQLNPRHVGFGLAAVVVAILIFSSFFQIGADSVGVVLRLGKFTHQVGPGLHFKLPLGIDRVYKVPTEKQLKEEFGFRTADSSGERAVYAGGNFIDESLMLTGDLNVIDVEWTVQYRISDPYNYLFRVRNVSHTFRLMTQAVMREVIGDRTVHEVLTVGRTELSSTVHARLQELCNQYEMGITVGQVILQAINPPEPVKPSFNEVNQAQQEMEKMINQARTEYNAEIPRARGVAQQLLQQAEGYEINRVNRAEGEASRFRALHEAYSLSPEVTRRRIYIETMADVLPQVQQKIIVGDNTSGLVPFMQLGTNAQQGVSK